MIVKSVWAHQWSRLLLATSLLLAGCGETGAESGTQATAGPESADEATARAQKAVLQPSDFPQGWEAQPEADYLQQETTWRDLTRCLGLEERTEGAMPGAVSPTYVEGDQKKVVSSVSYAEPELVTTLASALAADTAGCADEALAEAVGRAVPASSMSTAVQTMALDSSIFGGGAWAHRATATVDRNGVGSSLFLDFVVAFSGPAVSTLSFVSSDNPFPTELQRALLEKVARRADTR